MPALHGVGGCGRAHGRRFLIRLVAGEHRPAAHVVANFIGREIAPRHRAAGFEADHFEPGLRQRQHRHAARRAEPDDDDIRVFEPSRHVSCLRHVVRDAPWPC